MTSFEEFFSRFGPERHDGDQGRSSLGLLGRSLVQSWVARIAAVGVVAGVAALAVVFVFSGSKPVPVPAFLKTQLGASVAKAPKVLQPARGVKVALGKSGFTVQRQGLHATIASADAAGHKWAPSANGAARSTGFGNEVVIVTPKGSEQFLTVGKHHGTKTWSWSLSSSYGWPRVGNDGMVAFIDKKFQVRQDFLIEPVKILDAAG